MAGPAATCHAVGMDITRRSMLKAAGLALAAGTDAPALALPPTERRGDMPYRRGHHIGRGTAQHPEWLG